MAYNLRLEVSYLNDRRARLVLPSLPSRPASPSLDPNPAAAAIATSVSVANDGGTRGSLVTDPVAGANASFSGGSDIASSAAVNGGVVVEGLPDGVRVAAVDNAAAIGAAPAPAMGGLVGDAVVSGVGTEKAGLGMTAGDQEPAPDTRDGAGVDPTQPDGDIGINGISNGNASSTTKAGDTSSAAAVTYVLDENRPLISSSLGVSFGDPPVFQGGQQGTGGVSKAAAGAVGKSSVDKGARGFGGGGAFAFGGGGEHFAFRNQNLMTTVVWMAQGTQCVPADLKMIHYYTNQVI